MSSHLVAMLPSIAEDAASHQRPGAPPGLDAEITARCSPLTPYSFTSASCSSALVTSEPPRTWVNVK
eukprot:5792168-Prymnesium_polylepis.1